MKAQKFKKEKRGQEKNYPGRSSSKVHAPHRLKGEQTLPDWLGSPHQAEAHRQHPAHSQEGFPARSPDWVLDSLAVLL